MGSEAENNTKKSNYKHLKAAYLSTAVNGEIASSFELL